MDDLEREIHERIDYETRRRNKEYLDELQKLEKGRAQAVHTLGDSFGVHGHYDKRIKALDDDFKYQKQLDNERYDAYWQKYHDGTYKDEFHNAEREKKLENAENTIKKAMDVYGDAIPVDTFKKIEKELGKDVHERLLIRQKKLQEEQQAKLEAERLARVEAEKLEKQRQVRERIEKQNALYQQNREMTQGHSY